MAMGRATHTELPMPSAPWAGPHGRRPSAGRSGERQLPRLAPTEITDLVEDREDVALRTLPVVPDLAVAHAQHLQPVSEGPQITPPIPAESTLIAVVPAAEIGRASGR